MFVPDETPPPGVPFGRLDLTLLPPYPTSRNASPLRALLEGVADMRGQRLLRFEVDVPDRGESIDGYWLRLPARPSFSTFQALPTDLVSRAKAAIPAFADALSRARKGKLFVVGFVYPDEVSWRATRDDWLFAVLRITVGQKKSRPAAGTQAYIRTDWGGRDTLALRAPFLRSLADKSVLVVGLGALGSPLTMQLARAGVGTLSLLDDDYLQVGNTVRWATGWEYAGLDKASALSRRLNHDHPYTKVVPVRCRIGQDEGDYELVRELVRDADLVIDASAAYRVSHFLSDLCWHLGKPYEWLTSTPGSAGGVVGRVLARQSSCWHCFQRAMANGSVRLPQDGGTGDVQPGGCPNRPISGQD